MSTRQPWECAHELPEVTIEDAQCEPTASQPAVLAREPHHASAEQPAFASDEAEALKEILASSPPSDKDGTHAPH